ncbi:MAG: protein phosphatase CheZ [Alphaproteobacteria bacterium]|nr:protein phosphatase CheZ [Alphaproteobacteria bacterium]
MVKLTATKPTSPLQQQIGNALAAAHEPMTRDEVAAIIRQVMGSIEGDITATDAKFYREIEALARYIRAAKAEIAAIRPKDITSEHIPTATDQLDAVVGATEEATNKIMDECDVISEIAGTLPPEQSEKLTAAVTRIFEACNFQDLTGQRITKVVGALKHIETKIGALMTALGEEIGAPPLTPTADDEDPEKKLLNGPQMPGQGVSQDDIDRLFD